jgi:hypothetical protein
MIQFPKNLNSMHLVRTFISNWDKCLRHNFPPQPIPFFSIKLRKDLIQTFLLTELDAE